MYSLRNKPQSEMTARPTKYPQGRFKPKPCKECGTVFSPQAPSHLTCSQQCADRLLQTRYLKRTYGITLADYEAMYAEQGGKCAICNSEGFAMTPHHKCKLVVDHDHTTGKVRGLLCHNCNRALGLMHDSISDLQRAIDYLKVQRPSH